MRITVTVKPRSKISSIEGEPPDNVIVRLREPAVDGKANAALIEALALHFGVKKAKVKIVSGDFSRKKIVEISK